MKRVLMGYRPGVVVVALAVFICLAGVLVASAQEQPGFFEVTSNPSGAEVTLNGVFQGETPALVPVFGDGRNGTVLKLAMQGYLPWEETVQTSPMPGAVMPVKVTLVPVSPVGTLTVTSNPSGAMVSVDNGMAQVTPWTYRDLPTGVHLVSLLLPGYDPYIKNVQISPGQAADIRAAMQVRTSSGSLTVSSQPGGASIYLDEVYAGVTNTVVGNIPPGRHQLRVSRAGYEDYYEWVTVQAKEQTVVNAVLSQPAAPQNGSMVVTSEPPGASVFINGAFSGITETGRPLEITGLVPGSYQVYVSIRNYQDLQEIVQVKPGEIATVAAQLSPSPMPQDGGELILTSEPSGAEIIVDGIFRGQTPSTIGTISSGSHTYLLRLAGYRDYSSTVQVTPGQVLQVNTVMNAENPEGEKTPWPAPVVIVLILVAVTLVMSRRS